MNSTATQRGTSSRREADDLAALRKLHSEKRAGRLDQEGVAEYRSEVDRVLAELLAAQERECASGGRRRAPRVRRAVAVELRWTTGSVRAFTRELGMGGFSILVHAAFPEDALFATLNIRRHAFVRARVRIVKIRPARGCERVSCAFVDVPEIDAARLKDYIVEELLSDDQAAALADRRNGHEG